MKTNPRLTRINDEILKELSEIIRSQIKDPRLSTIISVVKVETSVDLQLCKVGVSILGDEKQRKEAMEGLTRASGFIRKLLAEGLNLRHTPELRFTLDDSLEYSMRMHKLIDEVNRNDSGQ